MAQDRLAKVITPLGDSLLLHSMSGREELGRLFAYELTLLSENTGIKANELLGQSVTVDVELADDQVRHFNGICTAFARGGGQGRYASYRATIRPWFWLLTRTADCRIFQNMTVPDVIKQVFRHYGLTDFDDALSGSYRTWDYIVQYRESAFTFVSRLMEQEGIYYYFKHESGKHTLVLSDGYGAHSTASNYAEVPFFPPEQGNLRERDHLQTWRATEQIQPGAYMLNDFDFTRPKASLQGKASDPRDHAKADMEIYDYPGEYEEASDGEKYAKARLQALMVQYEQLEGQGNARGLGAGNLFKLTGFPLDDQNREYLVVSTYHMIQNNLHETEHGADVGVRCDVSALESRTQFRPAQVTAKPVICGPQTAIVVGKAGEEIWTDQYGRVKVQFHWDRVGKNDENSSCWVRVSQLWAGGRWGGIHIPRIGQEVIVEFLEGDPDRPIITGRVYNGDNKPPYDLPANMTQSGIKSRSTKGGNPDNYNELRFEDKKGEEQINVQAEKNMDTLVKNDETLTVGHDRTKTIKNDETTSVVGFRTETVGKDETITINGSRIETVVVDETITITGKRTESVAQNETLTIAGATRVHNIAGIDSLNVAGARNVAVVGAHSLEVGGLQNISVVGASTMEVGGARVVAVAGSSKHAVKGSESTAIAGAYSLIVSKDASVSVTGGQTTKVGKDETHNVGGKLVITAAKEIVLKAGKATITLKENGDILVNGADLTVKGSGKLTAKAGGDMKFKATKIGHN